MRVLIHFGLKEIKLIINQAPRSRCYRLLCYERRNANFRSARCSYIVCSLTEYIRIQPTHFSQKCMLCICHRHKFHNSLCALKWDMNDVSTMKLRYYTITLTLIVSTKQYPVIWKNGWTEWDKILFCCSYENIFEIWALSPQILGPRNLKETVLNNCADILL